MDDPTARAAPSPSGPLRAAGAAALASVFFGGMVFATRFVVAEAGPVDVAFFRCAIGALCLSPVLWGGALARLRREDAAGVAALGLLLFAAMPLCLAVGLQYTYASRGALVLASQSFLTLALSRWRGEERLTPTKVLGIAMAFTGLALALGGRGPEAVPARVWIGDAFMLVAALCVSVYTVWSRRYLRHYPPLAFTAITMTVGAIALLPVAALVAWRHGAPAPTPLGWAALAYIGTFGAAIGYWLWCWALERTTPMRVAVFLTLNPITAAALGVAVLGEPVGAPFLVGAAVVVAGIALAHGGGSEGEARG